MENKNEEFHECGMEGVSIKSGDFSDEDSCSTPVEILSEFLSALMARNYKCALYYCKLIMYYEPENEVVQDFYPLIQEKIHLNFECESDSSSDENMQTLSESSTEYFTSTSVASASVCSSLSSDEEEDVCFEVSE
ncbi:glutamate-rich protein 2 isoform X2 [Parasteatoda tepidariorum]|uniref:glutamate-rich protein 2 isoform X2 n=1 Tax=Parasteatoda tepidariorum TaxID=114398 RepID=UPI00077FA358|nr:glutamate-rich protein 2 isoform X2 [Parasteatoda tepidariorum]